MWIAVQIYEAELTWLKMSIVHAFCGKEKCVCVCVCVRVCVRALTALRDARAALGGSGGADRTRGARLRAARRFVRAQRTRRARAAAARRRRPRVAPERICARTELT